MLTVFFKLSYITLICILIEMCGFCLSISEQERDYSFLLGAITNHDIHKAIWCISQCISLRENVEKILLILIDSVGALIRNFLVRATELKTSVTCEEYVGHHESPGVISKNDILKFMWIRVLFSQLKTDAYTHLVYFQIMH